MKDIFDFKRFGKYFVSDFRNCSANFGLSLITLPLMIYVVCYLISISFGLIENHEWSGLNLGIGSRAALFACIMFCIIVTMPVKCYGKITEKQYGSFWLTLPASRLEKFISMFLMTCIIFPIAGIATYLAVDALICTFDHTCGNNLIAGGMELIRNMGDIKELTMNLVDESVTIEDAALIQEIVSQMNSPLLYIDEIFGITLPFLLGAIFFKNGKTVKTMLVLFALSTVFSISITPIMENWASEVMTGLNDGTAVIRKLFDNGLFKNLALIDTISDTLLNLAIMTCIWFRIKTLKH